MIKLLLFVIVFYNTTINAKKSTCFGTTSEGKLVNGVKLPSSGYNFESYSKTAELLGRTYVHSTVKKILILSYNRLETESKNKVYKYAETGFKKGGLFKPHKTHRNGLSVDFMVPVINSSGKSVHLPTNFFNKMGYSIEFDAIGRYQNFKIDYKAMGAHIVSLHKAALHYGVEIWRVIFDPKLQPYLMKTKYEKYLKNHIQFSKKRSWVRHDEHYHVDFKIPCKSNDIM